MKVDELTAFIEARLDEDEAVAKAATPGPWERPLDVRNKAIVMAARPDDEEPRTWEGGVIPAEFADHKGPTGRYAGQRERVCVVSCPTWSDGSHDRKRSGRDLEHIARYDPARALREVEAKRAILARHRPAFAPADGDYTGIACAECERLWPCRDLCAIAAVWSDHPDYPPGVAKGEER